VNYVETSARENINVEKVFNNIIEEIIDNEKVLMKKKENSIKLGKSNLNRNICDLND